jgi:hypothetical protein
VQKLHRHGAEKSVFDFLSVNTSNPSISNLTLIEALIEKGDSSNTKELENLRAKLHSLVGVKA